MKKGILAILIVTALYLSSCQKESTVNPSVNPYAASTQGTVTLPKTGIAVNQGSVSKDTVSGFMVIKMDKDSINTDGLIIEFSPNASIAYLPNEDAPFLQGFGLVSFYSLSSDNKPLSINTLPLTSKGAAVKLSVHAKSAGVYKLNLTKIQSIPSNYDIWLMDKYRKDSLDFRHNPVYLFDLTKDTSSYGSNRFVIVTRPH